MNFKFWKPKWWHKKKPEVNYDGDVKIERVIPYDYSPEGQYKLMGYQSSLNQQQYAAAMMAQSNFIKETERMRQAMQDAIVYGEGQLQIEAPKEEKKDEGWGFE